MLHGSSLDLFGDLNLAEDVCEEARVRQEEPTPSDEGGDAFVEEEEEEERSPMKKAAPKRKKNTEQTTRRKRNEEEETKMTFKSLVDMSDDEELMVAPADEEPRVRWDPFADQDDGQPHVKKGDNYKTEVQVLLKEGDEITAVEMALRWKTRFSLFDSEQDAAWHCVRKIRADMTYQHGNDAKKGPREFLTYGYDKYVKVDPIRGNGPFYERHTYDMTWSIGVHSSTLQPKNAKVCCQPGELFLVIEFTVTNVHDGSTIIYRSMSDGFWAHYGSQMVPDEWMNVPRDDEECIVLEWGNLDKEKLLLRSHEARPPEMAPEPRRRKLFKEADVSQVLGYVKWDEGSSIIITFKGENPTPEKQIQDRVRFNGFKVARTEWDNPYTLVVWITGVKEPLWEKLRMVDVPREDYRNLVEEFIEDVKHNGNFIPINFSYRLDEEETDEWTEPSSKIEVEFVCGLSIDEMLT